MGPRPLQCWDSFAMAMADAEGFHAPAGNMRATDVARWCRAAGVLRPWQAGSETSENLGSPRRSWTWQTWAEGRQRLRHRRGNPDTEQGWNLRSTADQGTGKRRSPVTGKARRIGRGCLLTQRPQRGGKPTPRGRP